MLETRVDARRALLARLVDHAPTFPPASLSPPDALDEDRRARADPASFVLARLVWPASRWGDLGDERRELSAVLDAAAPDDDRVAAVELRHPGSLAGLAGLAGLADEVYVELPAAATDELGALAGLGLRAKVRCGGEAVPPPAQLAAFVRACRSAHVPFKATAGLHHAVAGDREHGLLNLLAAAVFGDEEEALAERDARAFRLDDGAFAWRGRSAGAEEIARVRRELLVSFGSCSFFEPVGELRALGLVPG